MNKEVQSIIRNFESSLSGEPWFGRAVYEILEEINEDDVFKKPGDSGHSMIELLYHMLTWAEYTLSRLDKSHPGAAANYEVMDWREIDPSIHDWQAGLKQFKDTHAQLIEILKTKNDDFLKEMVEEKKYNIRFLLNGLIQHNIYHLGQIAYVKKLFS